MMVKIEGSFDDESLHVFLLQNGVCYSLSLVRSKTFFFITRKAQTRFLKGNTFLFYFFFLIVTERGRNKIDDG